MKLLLVEDDISMQNTLRRALSQRHFEVLVCGDGAQVWAIWQKEQPDLVLLDLSLPNLDGLEVLQHARSQGSQTPVIVLTARAAVGDRVLGLNIGADDYLTKPFDLDELEARIRAHIRRQQPMRKQGESSASAIFGELSLDKESGAIYRHSAVFELAPREHRLLSALLLRPGQAVAKEHLYDLLFPSEKDVQFDAIDVVAYRLRKKLHGTGVALVTLRGLGYLLKLESSAPAANAE